MKRRFRHDRAVREEVKALPCCVCGTRNRVDPAHVATFGARGLDEAWAMVPLCRSHHEDQHRLGWIQFCKNHLGAAAALRERGWEFNTANGKTWLFNEKEKRNARTVS